MSRATQREDGWDGTRKDPVSSDPTRMQIREFGLRSTGFVLPVGYVKTESVAIDFNSLKRCKVQQLQEQEQELYDDIAPDIRYHKAWPTADHRRLFQLMNNPRLLPILPSLQHHQGTWRYL